MVSKESVANLIASMEGEVACLEEYIVGQKAFAAALKDREWVGLQAAMDGLEALSRRLAAFEALRDQAEAAIRGQTDCLDQGFYRLALLIQEPERTGLTDLYRRLKLTAMRARFENDSSASYASGSRDLLGAVLEELFPEKRGRIYGPSGRAVAAGHDSLVLNTAL